MKNNIVVIYDQETVHTEGLDEGINVYETNCPEDKLPYLDKEDGVIDCELFEKSSFEEYIESLGFECKRINFIACRTEEAFD